MRLSDTLVSILIPVCNAEEFLVDCLSSTLGQTYTHIEVIAIDDNSRDGSYAVLKEFAKSDKRVKIFRNIKRYGMGVTLNRAIRMARGRYLAFMNPHDFTSLNRIKRQLIFLAKHPKIVAVGTQQVLLDERSKRLSRSTYPLDHETIYHALVAHKTLRYESLLIDRSLLPKDLIKFSNHKYPLIFTELIVKLIQYGKIANADQHLYYHRKLSPMRIKFKQGLLDRKFSVAALWAKSIAEYDYRPSVKSLMQPLISPVKTIFD